MAVRPKQVKTDCAWGAKHITFAEPYAGGGMGELLGELGTEVGIFELPDYPT